jgi:hypothetical protein
MVESVGSFPFRKLRYETYLTLDVLKYIDWEDALKFMFGINKLARGFLIQKFKTIQNEFINDGLIPYYFGDDF